MAIALTARTDIGANNEGAAGSVRFALPQRVARGTMAGHGPLPRQPGNLIYKGDPDRYALARVQLGGNKWGSQAADCGAGVNSIRG